MKYFDGYIHGHIMYMYIYICICIYIKWYILYITRIKPTRHETVGVSENGIYICSLFTSLFTSITPVYGQVNVNMMIILGGEHPQIPSKIWVSDWIKIKPRYSGMVIHKELFGVKKNRRVTHVDVENGT